MKKMKMLLEAVIVITVVTALIMPGSAVVTNESETTTNKIIDTVKEYRKVLPIEGSSRGDDILIPSGEGENRIELKNGLSLVDIVSILISLGALSFLIMTNIKSKEWH